MSFFTLKGKNRKKVESTIIVFAYICAYKLTKNGKKGGKFMALSSSSDCWESWVECLESLIEFVFYGFLLSEGLLLAWLGFELK